jgi:signal transduction histidine kinase/CheY-like chemotaxis protein
MARHSKRLLLLFLLFLSPVVSPAQVNDADAVVKSQPTNYHSILLISSYNPDANATSNTITSFIEEYSKLGGDSQVLIENMNCLSFSEAGEWSRRMTELLSKYASNPPSLIILLGQEAWCSYLSKSDTLMRNVPVFCSQCSQNTMSLAPQILDSAKVDGNFKVLDIFRDFTSTNLKGGFLYSYNFDENLKMIRQFYPSVRKIALLTDNTCGGVLLQSYVRKSVESYPDVELILLDGRTRNFSEIMQQFASLPSDCAILLGTWRIDSTDAFFMSSSLQVLLGNTKLPVFSITSIGLNDGVLGCYAPSYRNQGPDLAKAAHAFFTDSQGKQQHSVQFVPNVYSFDYTQLESHNISRNQIPKNSIIVNMPPSFFQQGKPYFIVTMIIDLLLMATIAIVLIFYLHQRKLQANLEKTVDELKVAKEEAEKADALKSSFMANMSHELRTPLNAIVGFSRVLAEPETTPDEKKECISIIESNNSLLMQLIDDVLDLSKMESGNMPFSYAPVKINDLMGQIEETFTMKKTSTDVKVILEHKWEDLGTIRTDSVRLNQVIGNLLSNALKFTSHGTVRFGCMKQDENTLCFYVSDTGIGIPPDKLDLIFDRYTKLDQFSQGSGLGLYICKTIIRQFGGKVWAESKPGEGSTFRFTIPYDKVEEAAPVKKAEVGPIGAPPSSEPEQQSNDYVASAPKINKSRPVILVAEDHQSNFMLFQAILRNDYDVLHAEDGQKAVEMFSKDNPDLILMDIKMPVMDGYEATARIRKISADIPIIATTAFAFAEDEERIRASGFTDYIAKPIRNQALLDCVRDNIKI